MRLSDREPQKLTKTVRETVLSGGMVSCGVVSCGMVSCGVVICGMVTCGVVICGMVICGIVSCGVGDLWYGDLWCGDLWYGELWCGGLWYKELSNFFLFHHYPQFFLGQKLSLNIFSIIWYIYYQNKWSFSSKLAHHNTGVPPKDQITTV